VSDVKRSSEDAATATVTVPDHGEIEVPGERDGDSWKLKAPK
jgi:hypothetical protein